MFLKRYIYHYTWFSHGGSVMVKNAQKDLVEWFMANKDKMSNPIFSEMNNAFAVLNMV
jgi:hypothetical protein